MSKLPMSEPKVYFESVRVHFDIYFELGDREGKQITKAPFSNDDVIHELHS